MTTAQLSVGINTSSAKESLRELKQWLATSMSDVAVSIDPQSIDRQIAGYFKQRTFKFRVDTRTISEVGREVEAWLGNGIDKAFSKNATGREIRWNREQFYGSLKTALDGQFGQKTRRLEYDREGFRSALRNDIAEAFNTPQRVKVLADVSSQGTTGNVGMKQVEMAAIASTIMSSLTPAVDELSKAATTVAGVARQAGLNPRSNLVASRSASAIDPLTGVRTTVKASVTDAKGVIGEVAAMREAAERGKDYKLVLKDIAAENAWVAEQVAKRQRAEEDAQRARDAAWDEFDKRNKGSSVGSAFAMAEAAEAQRLKDLEKLRREQNKAQGQAAAREIAEYEKENAERALLAAQKEKAAVQSRFAALREARRRHQAMEKEAEARHQAEMRRFFENARLAAPAGTTAVGARILAAGQTAGRYGVDATQAMLGNQSYLLDQSRNLDVINKKTQDVDRSHKGWGDTMRQLHSGARGLMGTMGMMWLTWGSIVPLLAGAAIGQSIRTMITTGKELEYQLKFVQVLSDGAAVSYQDFSDVVAGSVVGPVEAAQALRGLAQNGLAAQEALVALPEILRLATVGEMDLASAALGATGVMEAFNLRFYDLGRVGDVFAKAAASSNTSVASMVESMKQASTVADQYKLTIEEVAASLAVLAQRNITGSAAGTAFRNMMSDLTAPTDKAKRALQAIGVELFDQNKQVKPYLQILEEMKGALAGLNEQSRKAVLGAIFDERGQKAAENLLNDYAGLRYRIDDLTTSSGFMKQAMDALGETTEGKIRRLSASFQLVSAEAFNASIGLKNVVDEMRVLVGTDEFRAALQAIADTMVDLTRFVAENLGVVVKLAATWVVARAGLSALTYAVTVALPALKALQVTMAGVAAVGMGVATFLTGGVGLALGLGAAYLLLKRDTNAVTEAHLEQMNSLRLMREEAERNLTQMETRNEMLSREIDLLYQGVDAIEAKRRAESEEKSSKIVNDLGTDLLGAYNIREAMKVAQPGTPGYNNLKSQLDATEARIESAQKLIALTEKQAELDYNNRKGSERVSLLNEANRLNSLIKDAGAQMKGKVPLIDLLGLASMSNEGIKQVVEKTRAAFNKAGRTVNIGNDDTARSMSSAVLQGVLDEIRDSIRATEERARAENELRDAQIGNINVGPVLQAEIAVDRARRNSAETVATYAAALEKLEAAKKLSALQPQDIQRINNEKAGFERDKSAAMARAASDEAIAKARLTSAIAEREAKDRMAQAALAGKVDDQMLKRGQKYELKVTDAVEAARAEASAATLAVYADEIRKKEEQIAEQVRAKAVLKDGELRAAEEQILFEQGVLTVLQAQALARASIAGSQAASLEESARSAEYGMKRFWIEYQNQAESTADQVYSVMKNTMGGLDGLVKQFVMTGKVSFKDFAASVMADVARMMASRAMNQFINFLLNAGLAYFGSSTTTVGTMASGSASTVGMSFENGGIMTSYGSLPLRKYDAAGIATRPMLALHGEGKRPEAYVPLPDGRTIPVTVSGGGGGGGINITNNIHIAADGRTSVSTDATGQQAAHLGRLMEQAVISVLHREKRAGGILAQA